MILQPLCISSDLAAAVVCAKARYKSLAGGARPSTHVQAFKGATDTLLIRIVLNLTADADVVQIMSVPLGGAQDYLFVVDEWTPPAATTQPFYPSAGTHTEAHMAAGNTGTLIVVGGRSGKPVVLVSSNPSVCSVAPKSPPVTFAGLPALFDSGNIISSDAGSIVLAGPGFGGAAIDGESPWTIYSDSAIGAFTITLNGLGTTSFSLNQAGGSGYAPAPTLDGGTLIFPQGYEPEAPVIMEGGVCIGGSFRFAMNNQMEFTMSGGVACGGALPFKQDVPFTMSGGISCGGSMPSYHSLDFKMSGGVAVGGAPAFRQEKVFTMSGGVSVGGETPSVWELTETAARMSGGVAVGGSHVFRQEGKFRMSGGVCLGGYIPSVVSSLTKPIATPFSVNFATPHSDGVYYITLLGTATRGGSLVFRMNSWPSAFNLRTYNGYVNGVLGNSLEICTPTYPSLWTGTETLDFVCIETTDDRVALTSNTARLTFSVAAPLTAAFTLSATSVQLGHGTITASCTSPASNTTGIGYIWQYQKAGDVVFEAGQARSVIITPFATGTYTVYLSITINGVVKATAQKSFTCTAYVPPAPTETWHWELQNTFLDIRGYAYWNSYMTLSQVDCSYMNPADAPQIAITSENGGWQITGNYWEHGSSGLPSGYKMLSQLWNSGVLPFPDANFANCHQNGDNFVVNKIFKWVYS